VEYVARGGNVEGATRTFEQLLAYANDVGLFAEEIDPDTGAALGNFPQAFTHIGLINAALTLAEYRDEHTFAGRDRSPTEKRSEDHT
jgi:GH15 family glucan-1,4-alpha-glucosidase